MSLEQLPDKAKIVFEVIRGRRSIREYIDRGIPYEHLKLVIEAGLWAPSASNLHPREFILIKNKDLIRAVKLVSPGLSGSPAAIIVLCVDHEKASKGGKMGETMALLDIATSLQNMMLMAYALGIGSCPIASFDKLALKEILRLPDRIEPVLLLSLGYPKRWPKPPPRKNVEEVLHVDGW